MILLILLFAAIPVLAGIFLGPSLLPESTGRLQTAHRQLIMLCKEIENKAGDRADPVRWKGFSKSIQIKLSDAVKPLATSKHRAKPPLMSAKTALHGALRAQTQEDFDRKLQDARRKLHDAKKKLGL